jgi:pyruvate dehydrogenase E1 component alpha subunit
LILFCENNGWGLSVPTSRSTSVPDIATRAAGYGMPGIVVDGNDADAVYQAVARAAERARAGEGPTLIEAVTMRMHGHGAHDDMKYVPKEMVEEWAGRDPIERYEKKLRADGIDVDAIRAEAKALVDEDTDWALAQPMPDAATATDGVFAEKWEPLGDGKAPWSHWAQETANA